MPTELRVFQRVDPHAGALASTEVASAAEKLREAGRGPDVLYEDVRAEPPRAPGDGPAPDENRAEHVIVTMPGGASPWATDGAAAKALAAGAIDKAALPSATAAALDKAAETLPAAMEATRDKGTAAAHDKGTEAERPSAAEAALDKAAAAASVKPRPVGGERRLLPAAAGLLVAALLVFALVRGWMGSVEPAASGDAASGSAPHATGMGVPPATGAAMTTGAAMMTGAAMTTGAPAMTETPGASGTSQAPAVGTGTRAVPKGTGDPYGDAGAPPRPPVTAQPTASVEPTSAPVVTATTSVAPAVTGAPSAKPSATGNPWDVVFEKRKESGN